MHLFKHARIHQIFGANTDVGKTILSTALVLASATRGRKVRYLKPVSTGPIQDADDEFVKRFSSSFSSQINVDCIYRYKEPVSPHLALQLERGNEPKVAAELDGAVNTAISKYVRDYAGSNERTDIYIETAGGVHSPSLSGRSQVDSYRPLRLPSILIGGSKLGGISSTISSYESLAIRGYSIDAVLLFEDTYYRNWEYLANYFSERGIHVAPFPHPPPKLANPEENYQATKAYYEKLLENDCLEAVSEHLDRQHDRRIDELHTMPRRTMESIWWPFVQHGLTEHPKDVTVIDSAHGDFFSVYTGHAGENRELLQPLYDGSASWWTQAFGHGDPSLALAAARAAGRYGHVMFPQASHLPALKLAERLLAKDGPGNGWASRVFFSDNGSTAMEVALKMALRAYCTRHGRSLDTAERQNLGVLGLKGSYHGDTIGAMDACYAGEGVFTCEWHSARGYWLDAPRISMCNGKAIISLPDAITAHARLPHNDLPGKSIPWIYNVSERLNSELVRIYRRYIEDKLRQLEATEKLQLAALVLEPLIMGAGGMVFVDPLFQRILVDVVREREPMLPGSNGWRGLPVIFDEVFVGMYRTGWQSCIPTLGVKPDIAAYAKTLTGGIIPLAVTLASPSIFDAFLSKSKADALLHGHSYTAHAVGCEVANESIAILDRLVNSDSWRSMQAKWNEDGEAETPMNKMWSFWDPGFVEELSKAASVKSVSTLGTVLSFKVEDPSGGYQSHTAQERLKAIGSSGSGGESFGVHFRTLGDVAYFMTSFNTPDHVVRSVETKIMNALCNA